MASLEDKYGAHKAFNELNSFFDNYLVEWEFKLNNSFEVIAKKFIDSKGVLDRDVFYIVSTNVDNEHLKELKNGEIIDFGNQTYLEKIGDEKKHNYYYYNEKPLVFGVHEHIDYHEVLTPLLSDLVLYEFEEDRFKRIVLKVNESYTFPKGVKHAVLFSDKNKIKLVWE